MQIMQPNTITNEILYNLLIDFKNDVNRRFDEQERRFDKIEARFDRFEAETNNRFNKIEATFDKFGAEVAGRFDQIDKNENRVRIRFSTIGAIFNALIAALVGGTVTFVLNDR